MTEYRLLTRAEAATVPGMVDPLPDSLFVMGAIDESGIIAAVGAFTAVHLDPLWIREDKRKCTPCMLRKLWENMHAELWRRGADGIEVGMTETNPGQPTEGMIERMCKMAGGHEIKARFFLIPIKETPYGKRAPLGDRRRAG